MTSEFSTFSCGTGTIIDASSLMRKCDEILEVSGEGGLSIAYSGVLLYVSSARGKLQLYRKKRIWTVKFRPDNRLRTSTELTLSRHISMPGYMKARSFFDNFVPPQAKVQIYFEDRGFLSFSFEDAKRDEEILRKMATIFEYFYNKNERHSRNLPIISHKNVFSKATKTKRKVIASAVPRLTPTTPRLSPIAPRLTPTAPRLSPTVLTAPTALTVLTASTAPTAPTVPTVPTVLTVPTAPTALTAPTAPTVPTAP
uniref:Uncharacterized protein n=1 Tax=Strigamia maritima TaxID=126957 RepID=T1J3F7_STRMM